MRTFLVLLSVAVLDGLFLAQKHHEQKIASAQAVATQTAAPRKVSEHNWMKNSLDTTNKVKQQVAQQRKDDPTR
ncbi:MAG: hypothetical protein DLM73_14960 [Chthoniobacterales bacterium]|nr:MAG: hypothetical protein DLM73_14960 [Chthoniobacterales bacterium]